MKIPPKKAASKLSPVKRLYNLHISDALIHLEELHTMYKMRGRESARVLLVAPPCTEPEYQAKIPFCGEPARLFHEVLEQRGLSTETHFVVVACSAFGKKASKDSTELTRRFIADCVKENLFDFYICVGDEAFKHIFGAGKKPSSATLYGSTVYTSETGHKPLFTFPNPANMIPEEASEQWQTNRFQRVANDWITRFSSYADKLVESLTRHKIKI